MDVSRNEAQDMVADAKRMFGKAEKAKAELKRVASVLLGGLEAFAAPLVLGGIEGRFARDGSSHIAVAGIPANGGLGALFLVAGASGILDEVGPHVADSGKGLVGGFGQDVGRQVGLRMRLAAGLPVLANLLPAAKRAEIEAGLSAEAKNRLAAASAAGGKEYMADRGIRVGDEPQRFSPDYLQDLVKAALAQQPRG